MDSLLLEPASEESPAVPDSVMKNLVIQVYTGHHPI